MQAYRHRFAALSLSLGLTAVASLGLSGCEKFKRLIEKPMGCGDPNTLQSLQKQFKAEINTATKAYLTADNDIDQQTLKKLLNQIKIDLDQIQDQPNGNYRCSARVNLTLPKNLLERANETRAARGDDSVSASAAAQDINLQGIGVYQDIEYTPNMDNDKIRVTLSNARSLQNFLASLLVDASQTPYDGSDDDTDTSDSGQYTNGDNMAIVATGPAQYANNDDSYSTDQSSYPPDEQVPDISVPTHPTPKKYGPAAAPDIPVPDADNDAANQKIVAATRRANAETDQKRKEFNQMWQSASPEAQASLTDDQKQWVKERDEQCANEAQQADAGYEEYTRLQCVGRMLDERYTQVKAYFEDYDQ